MPKGFGRNSFLAWVEEAVYGTPVTPPVNFAEVTAEDIRTLREREPRPVHRGLDVAEDDMFDVKFGVEGPFTIELNYAGQLKLLEHLLGAGSTAVLEAVISWTHTFLLTDALQSGKGLTFYTNRDLDEHQHKGCKLTQGRFIFEPGGNGKFEVGIIGQDSVGVVASTFVAPGISLYLAGHQIVVELDDSPRLVDRVELTVNNVLDTDKRVLGSKSIDEPIRSGVRREVTGVVTVDALDTDWDKFLAGTLFKLKVIHTGPVLGINNYTWAVTALKCLTTEDPIRMPSPGILKAEIAFRAEKPATGDMLSVVVQNAEEFIT